MPKTFADIFQQIKGIFLTMSAGKIMSLFILVVATIAGIVALVNWSGSPDYQPLYSNLAPEEAGEVIGILRDNKIEYKLSYDGSTIQVPRERIYEIRLDLAAKGLPRNGNMGFEVFDNTKLGTTDFVQNINYQRALQGELSRTINGLDEVDSSRVHIVMTPRSLFIEDEEPATASVILKLRNGRHLSEEQIQGIIYLVSSSIPRLEPKNVTLVDQNGSLLAGLDEEGSAIQISNHNLEFQRQKEKLIESRVVSMLEKVLGRGRAIVRVACELDFIQQENTQELFLPENQVVRSEQVSNESATKKESSVEGIPGLASNVTNENSSAESVNAPVGFSKEDLTRNFEIGKTTTRQILPVGQLRRLSVAVVVDGTYEKIMVGKGDEQHEETKYVARTPEEMATFEAIVKRAVSYDEQRGDQVEVANMPINNEQIGGFEEIAGVGLKEKLAPFSSIIKYAVVAIFVIFTFLYIIRPLIRWLIDTPWEDVELLEHLPQTVAEIERQYSGTGQGNNAITQAAQIIASHQNDSSNVARQWMKET